MIDTVPCHLPPYQSIYLIIMKTISKFQIRIMKKTNCAERETSDDENAVIPNIIFLLKKNYSNLKER